MHDLYIGLGKRYVKIDKEGVFTTSLTKVGQIPSFFNVVRPLHDENGVGFDLVELKRITKDYLETLDK